MGAGGGGGVALTGAGLGVFLAGMALGAGGGGAVATGAGRAGAWTVRLLTTVLRPATWAASAAARERAASLLTVPLSVAMPFCTEVWMGSLLRAVSLERRLWRAALREASSVGAAAGLLLQPATVSASASAVMATKERDVEPDRKVVIVIVAFVQRSKSSAGKHCISIACM